MTYSVHSVPHIVLSPETHQAHITIEELLDGGLDMADASFLSTRRRRAIALEEERREPALFVLNTAAAAIVVANEAKAIASK